MSHRDDLLSRVMAANPLPNEHPLPDGLDDWRPPLAILIDKENAVDAPHRPPILPMTDIGDELLSSERSRTMDTQERPTGQDTARRTGWRTAAIAFAAIIVVVGAVAAFAAWISDDDSDVVSEPVSFTFTDDCTQLAERPTSPAFSAEGPDATFYTCEIRDPSDPRFAGTEIWSYPTGAPSEDGGILEITTEDGTWVGSYSGPSSLVTTSVIGTGDYEGLQATWYGPGCERNCDWQGTIEPIPEP